MLGKVRSAVMAAATTAMVAAGALATISTAPAEAAQLRWHPGHNNGHWHGNWNGNGWHGHWHGNNGWNGWYGPAFGFGTGFLFGSMLAQPYYYSPQPYYYPRPYYPRPYYRTRYTNADAWCAARFRSFNPVTNLYTGYDGLKHHCP